MKERGHLQHSELVEYLDDELDERKAAGVRLHISECAVCLAEHDRLAEISARVRALVGAAPVEASWQARATLLARLSPAFAQATPRANGNASQVMKRFGWGMAMAASVALALVLIPHRAVIVDSAVERSAPVRVQQASLDVNGESFVALPYSNPDLPLNTPRIVEMQVPVSSLTAAGIALDPVSNGAPDRTVRANVLLGIDGQPLGLHVLSAE